MNRPNCGVPGGSVLAAPPWCMTVNRVLEVCEASSKRMMPSVYTCRSAFRMCTHHMRGACQHCRCRVSIADAWQPLLCAMTMGASTLAHRKFVWEVWITRLRHRVTSDALYSTCIGGFEQGASASVDAAPHGAHVFWWSADRRACSGHVRCGAAKGISARACTRARPRVPHARCSHCTDPAGFVGSADVARDRNEFPTSDTCTRVLLPGDAG